MVCMVFKTFCMKVDEFLSLEFEAVLDLLDSDIQCSEELICFAALGMQFIHNISSGVYIIQKIDIFPQTFFSQNYICLHSGFLRINRK